MPEHNFQEQKEQLLKEKAKLEEEVKELKTYPDLGVGDEDNTQEATAFEGNIPLENEAELILQKENKALDAIENGTYGRCEKCQKAIEDDRLEAMPWADLCVSCKNEK
jgi:RNA polymerase-binding transcription factor DksA